MFPVYVTSLYPFPGFFRCPFIAGLFPCLHLYLPFASLFSFSFLSLPPCFPVPFLIISPHLPLILYPILSPVFFLTSCVVPFFPFPLLCPFFALLFSSPFFFPMTSSPFFVPRIAPFFPWPLLYPPFLSPSFPLLPLSLALIPVKSPNPAGCPSPDPSPTNTGLRPGGATFWGCHLGFLESSWRAAPP